MTYRRLGTRRVFEGRVVNLRVDEIEPPSGRRFSAEIVEHRGAVAMVPLLPDGQVLLVRQYRFPVGRDLLEVPAGTIEPGEAPDTCARRELAEEVGRAASRWEHLISFFPSPGVLTEELHVYLAQDLRAAQASGEEEDLRVESRSLADARRAIETGEIRDSKSIIGLLLACERFGIGR